MPIYNHLQIVAKIPEPMALEFDKYKLMKA